jgi:hypothetical protein
VIGNNGLIFSLAGRKQPGFCLSGILGVSDNDAQRKHDRIKNARKRAFFMELLPLGVINK